MKRPLLIPVIAALLAIVSLLGGAHPQAKAEGIGIAFHIHPLALSPDFQQQNVDGMASVLVTAAVDFCFFASDGGTTSPAFVQSTCGFSAPVIEAPQAFGTFSFSGFVKIVAGPNSGSQFPFALSRDVASIPPTGNFITYAAQQLIQYPDFSGKTGTDLLVGHVIDLSVLEEGHGNPSQDENLISNQVQVDWVRNVSRAVDPGIFVRRTPVVQQAAAPAAPAVQAPATGTGRITAPNTGDAGLQASAPDSPTILLLAGAVLLTTACVGFALYRLRRPAI